MARGGSGREGKVYIILRFGLDVCVCKRRRERESFKVS